MLLDFFVLRRHQRVEPLQASEDLIYKAQEVSPTLCAAVLHHAAARDRSDPSLLLQTLITPGFLYFHSLPLFPGRLLNNLLHALAPLWLNNLAHGVRKRCFSATFPGFRDIFVHSLLCLHESQPEPCQDLQILLHVVAF